MSTTVRPHRIAIDDEVLADTARRLSSVRWSVLPTDGADRYGASVPDLRRVLDYWAEKYSWREWEQRLNAQPHFLAPVDGVDVHFWHIRAADGKGIPLLLVHGWPGAAVEYWELIGPLTDPAAHGAPGAPSFDLVIPELPGFGFGGKPAEPGWSPSRMAGALHSLMHDTLGYDRYAVHGEDWGSNIGTRMAAAHPDEVAGLQVTMPYVEPVGELADAPEAAAWQAHMMSTIGYAMAQGQVPDALTFGMADSPLALAAWVLEKFSAWSDHGEDLFETVDLDVLVTILNFYWLPASIISATRVYRESALDTSPAAAWAPVTVPTSVSSFPKEPFSSPEPWLPALYKNIQSYHAFERGGHFATLEQPETVLTEIRDFFPPLF